MTDEAKTKERDRPEIIRMIHGIETIIHSGEENGDLNGEMAEKILEFLGLISSAPYDNKAGDVPAK